MSDVVEFESHVLAELVALRSLVEVLMEKTGIEYTPRPDVPAVRSIGALVADLVNGPLAHLESRIDRTTAVPTVRQVVRDADGEISHLVDLPASAVTVTQQEQP